MITALTVSTWEEALRDFLLHLKATRAEKTVRYYSVQLGLLARWAEGQQIPLQGFGKRHMDRYLVERAKSGRRPLTIRHDCVCAKAFLRWCSRDDILKKSLPGHEERLALSARHGVQGDAALPAVGPYTVLVEAPALHLEHARPVAAPAIHIHHIGRGVGGVDVLLDHDVVAPGGQVHASEGTLLHPIRPLSMRTFPWRRSVTRNRSSVRPIVMPDRVLTLPS